MVGEGHGIAEGYKAEVVVPSLVAVAAVSVVVLEIVNE